MFLRDAKQAEVLLNQQETFLSKEDVPVRLFYFISIYSRTSMAWTGLRPWKIVLAKGSSSHSGWIMPKATCTDHEK